MGLFSREIRIEQNGQLIEVSGGLDSDMSTTTLDLHVDGVLQDTLSAKPKDGIFGCNLCLTGKLKNNIPIRVQIKTHFFMRPLYT